MTRNLSIFIMTLLLIFIPTIVVASDLNEIQLFFIPEQGFLRVNTSISLEPDTTYLSFKLFPNAQVTNISAPNLKDNTISPSNSSTSVEVTFAPEDNNQILQLSYEGFLVNYDSNLSQALDQESLWFPKLTQEIHPYQLMVTLPTNFTPYFDGDLVDQYQSTFSSYTWESNSESYPTIYFSDFTETDEQELAPETETVIEVKPEFDFEVVLPIEEPEPVNDEDMIRSQIHSLTEAIANQDQFSVSDFLDPQLRNPQLFIQMLEGRPSSLGPLTISIEELGIDGSLAKVTGIISAEQDNQFQVISTWKKDESQWLLADFRMIPATYIFFDPESDPELATWIEDLQEAIVNQDLPWLDYHLTMAFNEKLPIIEFFQHITSETIWETVAISESDDRIITLIYDPQTTTKFKLEFSLNPTEYLRISRVKISTIL